MRRLIPLFLLLSFFLIPNQKAFAQDPSSRAPVYVVQKGDTLYSIAIKFGVSVNDIKVVNNFDNPDFLVVGSEIVIPGLDGVQGRLVTETIQLGEDLRSTTIRRQISPEQLSRLNRLTSPAEVYVGASLIIPEPGKESQLEGSALIQAGGSLLEAAAGAGQNPWLMVQQNDLSGGWGVLTGEALFTSPGSNETSISLVSPLVKSVEITPLPLIQGETDEVKVSAAQPIELSGAVAGNPLRFFSTGGNQWAALQGINAMADPGIYPVTIEGKLQDGRSFKFEQMVVLQAAGYATESINGVDPATLDPANTKPENDQIAALVAPVTEKKYWDGVFKVPGYDPKWITSWFGTRRIYNGDPKFSSYHAGIDYGGGTGLEIKADAPGKVVFTGPLIVRGNATVIDHGWGVYTAFFHQSEFKVNVGDEVTAGQVIGLYGGTGRVTGPHLHWEIWVNGVQVNPLTWLEQAFP